jgi:hypothetical protein
MLIFAIVWIVRRPRRAIRVFVISRASAASTHFHERNASIVRPKPRGPWSTAEIGECAPPRFSTLFHNLYASGTIDVNY